MVRNLSFQCNGLCSSWGTEHRRRVTCYQQGEVVLEILRYLSVRRAGGRLWPLGTISRRQSLCSRWSFCMEREGGQSPAGWSPAHLVSVRLRSVPRAGTTRITLMDSLLHLTLSAPVPLSAPTMRGSVLVDSHWCFLTSLSGGGIVLFFLL